MEVPLLERAGAGMKAAPVGPEPSVCTIKLGEVLMAMRCSAHLPGVATAISSQQLEAAYYCVLLH
eukprot:3113989-Pyramimonas_sp.AAC.1